MSITEEQRKTAISKQAEAKDVSPQGWASSVTPASSSLKKPVESQAFLKKIAPKSKKGRLLFAVGTAQVVSIALVSVVGIIFKDDNKPKAIKNLESALGKLLAAKPTKVKNWVMTPDGWKGFLDLEERELLAGFAQKDDKTEQYALQLGKVIEMLVLGTVNILSTMGIRNYMDKRLDIHLGKGNVLKTQLIDTAAGLGAMFLLPKISPDGMQAGRKGIENALMKLPHKDERKHRNWARSAGFTVMNVTLPDFFGFAAGIGAMMRELDQQEKEAEEEKQKQKENSEKASMSLS